MDFFIKTNGYDQYDVDELYFDEDINRVSYENVDENSWRHVCWRYTPYLLKQLESPKVKIDPPTLLVDILMEKLGIEPELEVHKWGGEMRSHSITFMPKAKKVKITIEEVE